MTEEEKLYLKYMIKNEGGFDSIFSRYHFDRIKDKDFIRACKNYKRCANKLKKIIGYKDDFKRYPIKEMTWESEISGPMICMNFGKMEESRHHRSIALAMNKHLVNEENIKNFDLRNEEAIFNYCYYIEDRKELWAHLISPKYIVRYCFYINDRPELYTKIMESGKLLDYCECVENRPELWTKNMAKYGSILLHNKWKNLTGRHGTDSDYAIFLRRGEIINVMNRLCQGMFSYGMTI